MEPLARLLQRLRIERRLTQRDLAIESGFSDEVIAKIEGERGGWSPRTARWVLTALARKLPITEREAHDFLVQSNVTISIGGRLPNDEFESLVAQGLIRGLGKAAAAPVPERASLSEEISRLIADVGEEAAAKALRCLAEILGASPKPETVSTTLRSTPIQRRTPDGVPYVEQIIAQTLEPSPTAKSAEVSSTPHRRKKRGA